jgi:norsolorinic acid ketoreductase
VQRYLRQDNTIVIAGVRDPSKSSQALKDLPKGKDSRIVIVKIDSCSATDALEAVKDIQKQGIQHLNVVIANAGVAYSYSSVKDLKIEDLQGHIEPNVQGPIRLYQATAGLLAKASTPKWVTIGSTAGRISVSVKEDSPLSIWAQKIRVLSFAK